MPKIKNKPEKFVLLIVMTFMILAVVLTAVTAVQKRDMEKRSGKADLNGQLTAEQQLAEQNAAKMGWNKMITGELAMIDEIAGLVYISIDPLGENEKHGIRMTSGTKFFRSELNMAPSLDCETDDCEELEFAGEEIVNSSFHELRQGQLVEVHFPQRVDIDSGATLVAEKVVILQD